jgi:hypothetical protein
LDGATRSEYGTGVWFSSSQDVAVSASGRTVPANSVPLASRTFSDASYVHEIPPGSLDGMHIPSAVDVIDSNVTNNMLRQLDNNRFMFSDVIPYGDDLTDELVNVLENGKLGTYGGLFDKVDALTRKVSKRSTGTVPDEYELTYVQRVVTDLLQGSGVQGITNGVNTVVYDTRKIPTKFIHDVTDIAGDATDDVTTALHNVNLLQRSVDAEPNSKMLQVQLIEAKATAASKIRDSLSDELDTLNSLHKKQVSDLMDYDDTVTELASRQRSEAISSATVRDTNTYQSFKTELSKDWNGPCL